MWEMIFQMALCACFVIGLTYFWVLIICDANRMTRIERANRERVDQSTGAALASSRRTS